MKQFETNVAIIMKYLRSEGFSPSVLSAHRLCYQELLEYLTVSGQEYSPEIAYQWIETNKSSWSYRKYTGYRHCIDQLEDIRKDGSISLDHLCFRKPAYNTLSPYFKIILDDFIKEHTEADDRYRIACARFLLYLQNNGISVITELDYEILIRYHFEDYHSSAKSKDVYEGLIRKFLKHLAAKGMCPQGLSLALNKLLIHQIIKLPQEELDGITGKAVPMIAPNTIDEFLVSMKNSRYGKTVMRGSRHILTLLYIFLDMHNISLNDRLLWYWFSQVKPLLGAGWKQHRRSICQFLYFMETGAVMTGVTGNPQTVKSDELLPAWQKGALTDYLSLLKREGWQPSTIAMQKSSNLRFFRYLQDRKVDCFKGLTSDIIKDFNLQDRHKTPEGKAAYNCRIRSFLIFLYEQGLIEDPYLYRALPTAVSDRVSVVQTLSKEDVAAIWAVNPDELSPKALRDYAMVCIGLTMGFRASDIVSIRFSDIDWKQKSICVIQQKTGKALVLPMPVKTGNILFRYLRDGRPKSDEPYVFIRHEAPYDRIQRGVCRSALKRFLGIQKHSGCNFHAVRKTFATKLLEGGTDVELISDALGHSNDSTVHKYLSLDEKRMRMCPLSMAETGIFFKGGAFHA